MDLKELIQGLTGEECISLTPLSGGVTNGSYLAQMQTHQYVIRIPGDGTNQYINRAHEVSNLQQASSLGCVPKIIHADGETGVIITQYLDQNLPMNRADIHNPEHLRLICERMGSVHCSGLRFGNEFNIVEQMRTYQQLLAKMSFIYPQELLQHMNKLEGVIDELFAHPEEIQLVPCHGDPKLNNFLLQGNKLWLIDWEYSGMAEYYFDLVNLVMTDDLNKEEEELFLSAYEQYVHLPVNRRKYLMYRIAADYLWIFWHLIKLHQGELVEYNTRSWKRRLARALASYEQMEESK